MSVVESTLTSSHPSDPQLAALRLGSKEAVAALFLEYRERLERMVTFRLDQRLLGRIDAADVVQEAYIEVARRINDFLAAPRVSLFVWFRQITWQTLLDVHRRHLGQKRNAGQEVSLNENNDLADATDRFHPLVDKLAGSLTSPSQAAMRNERSAVLKTVIAQMEPLDREILVLRHFEQLTNTEVAEVLELTKTAASNRYIRALRRLRECLDSCQAFDQEA